jgi:2,5-diketo-D-gluconate reductase B
MLANKTPAVRVCDAIIPVLGFGTAGLVGDDARRMVLHALNVGYRHIDTAQVYNNENEIGAAIRASSVSREEIFLTTKVWIDRFKEGELQQSVEESLGRLRTDGVELLLLHWPNPNVPLRDTMRALNTVKRSGLTKHIGLSNFTTALMEDAIAFSDEPLVVNQVEYHPFLSQRSLLTGIRAHGMGLIAYSPLAQGGVFKNETLKRIAENHGVNPGQVALRWLIQQESVIAIPMSRKEEHAVENLSIFDFTLSKSEMSSISSLARPNGRLLNWEELVPEWD